MHTEIVTTNDEFDTLAEAWDDLLSRAAQAPFYMHYCYQRTWWRYLGEGELFILTVRAAAGEPLLGLLPLYTTTTAEGQQQLSLLGCIDVSDYLEMLVDADHTAAVHQALITAVAELPWKWDKLFLCSLSVDSLTHTEFAEAVEAHGWRAERSQQDVCPVITLAETWDDYLAGIDKKQRHEIRRKIRKINRVVDVDWYAIDSEEGLPEAMDDFFALHRLSDPEKEDFWDDNRLAFFRTLATETAKKGWLKLYFLEVNGIKAATMLCFDYDNEFLLYNSGFDPQFYKLSTGNVLTSHTIQHAIELGRERYDFLRGDEEYKFRFGAEAEPVYDLEIYRT